MAEHYELIPLPAAKTINDIEWRAVPDQLEYSVSEYGHVRRDIVSRGARLRVIRPQLQKHGYITYNLWSNGVGRTRYAHHLVALAFIGPRPVDEPEVAHCDGNALNNHYSNLRYDDRAGNAADTVRHGTSCRGSKHGASKLTAEDVREIRRMRSEGGRPIDIAKIFGVTRQNVSHICTRTSWGHLTGEGIP